MIAIHPHYLSNLKLNNNMIYYPILFRKCTVRKFVFSSNVSMQNMTMAKRIALIGIKTIQMDLKNGGIKQITHPKKKKKCAMSFDHFFEGSFLGGYSTDFLASNYLILFNNESYEDFLAINVAFKLWTLTSSGISYSIAPDKNSFGFSPPSHFGGTFDYANITLKDLRQIKKIFEKYKTVKDDEHLKLMIDNFFYALSGEKKINYKIRFIQLTTILEMLYVPNGQQELSFRLAIRAAKIIGKNKSYDAISSFGELKKIYEIRSKIVHQGEYKKEDLQKYFGILANFVRISLFVYLDNPKVFKDEMLNAIVLKS